MALGRTWCSRWRVRSAGARSCGRLGSGRSGDWSSGPNLKSVVELFVDFVFNFVNFSNSFNRGPANRQLQSPGWASASRVAVGVVQEVQEVQEVQRALKESLSPSLGILSPARPTDRPAGRPQRCRDRATTARRPRRPARHRRLSDPTTPRLAGQAGHPPRPRPGHPRRRQPRPRVASGSPPASGPTARHRQPGALYSYVRCSGLVFGARTMATHAGMTPAWGRDGL
jgi:hypothetical protein